MDSSQNKTIDIENMSKSDAVFIIWQLLNKAQSKGVFTIDEACAAKSAIKIVSEDMKPKSDDD